jgi:hypothetical protein
VINPELNMYVPGQSWWTYANDLICVPADLVASKEYKKFVSASFPRDDDRCVRYG